MVANHKENEVPWGGYEAYSKIGILLFKNLRGCEYNQSILLAYIRNAIMKMLCMINICQ